MDGLTIVAGFVMILLVFLAIFVFVDLAALPGRIAVQHGHSQPDAVKAAGIVGLLAGGVLWPFALAWAFIDFKALGVAKIADAVTDLDVRLASLEADLAQSKGAEKRTPQ